MRVLLSGATGFVGSHVLRHLLANTDWDIVCPATFRHCGQSARVASALGYHCRDDNHLVCRPRPDWEQRVTVILHDLRTPIRGATLAKIGDVDYILNIASESHVDRAIADPARFIDNNVRLITTVLDFAREIQPRVVLHMSTDEVYGPAPVGCAHREWDPIKPSNPYSASKAAQEAITFAYWRTYRIPVVITNTMNIIGETQDTEKFLPKTLRAVLRGETVTVHADLRDPDNPVIGSRHWLHARNLADAWLWILQNLTPDRYPHADEPLRLHIVGEELTNLELAEQVAAAAGRGLRYELEDFHASRPGHDLRYALDGSKIEALGWKPPVSLAESLHHTVDWTIQHPEWLA